MRKKVLVLSNRDPAWMESSQTMGRQLGSCRVEAVTTESFDRLWNLSAEPWIVIHTHGSPTALSGDGLRFTVEDGARLLWKKESIRFVVMTACSTGGDTDGKNMGQLLSEKIDPKGAVICATTTVSGADTEFTATQGGHWRIYRNGCLTETALPATITLTQAAEAIQEVVKWEA